MSELPIGQIKKIREIWLKLCKSKMVGEKPTLYLDLRDGEIKSILKDKKHGE